MIYILWIFPFLSLFSQEQESTTCHTINLNGETLEYTVTVSAGKVGSISYIKNTTIDRPITFAFNGGPGSSSVWLHIGTLGPRRILTPEEGQKPIPPYQLVDNLETILDLTDLVFIDPVSTGLSIEKADDCYSIRGDITSVGDFIRDYLTQTRRWNSPKYLIGESYGTTRAVGLAEYLQNTYQIYLNGLILISNAIDFQTFVFTEDNPLPYFLYLPTYAATAWYHGLASEGKTLSEVVESSRTFAWKEYGPALLCPSGSHPEELYQKLAEFTSIPVEHIKEKHGLIDEDTFSQELLRGKVVGRFDSRVVGNGPASLDPSLSQIEGIFSGAFHDYLHRELEFQKSYTLFSLKTNEQWNFHDYNHWGYPNLTGTLRRSLKANPSLKLFIAAGYFDLVTPFGTIEYTLGHVDIPKEQLQVEYYLGGHMFYLTPSERIQFKQNLIHFYKDSL